MIQPPTPATLKKYGLSLDEWWAFIPYRLDPCTHAPRHTMDPVRVCPVCRNVPKTGRMVVDHQHVRSWKKMKPEERKRYVRGVVCVGCNFFVLTRQITALKHRNAAEYLEAYEERKHE